jgi:hypothetical protein
MMPAVRPMVRFCRKFLDWRTPKRFIACPPSPPMPEIISALPGWIRTTRINKSDEKTLRMISRVAIDFENTVN